jgi:xylulokinase
MLCIGIDSGTQSTKSIVVDVASGEVVASAQQTYGLIQGLPPGHMEQDPKAWSDAVDDTIQACLYQLGERKHDVRAIGVSGQQHGLVVLDNSNRVIRPTKLWCDVSTAKQCQTIIEAFGGETAQSSSPVTRCFQAGQLQRSSGSKKTNRGITPPRILLPHDYLNFWLTGETRMEYGDASGTGLLDVRTRKWCRPVMEFIDPTLEDKLPPLGSSRQAVGLLREGLRQQWGLKKSPRVSAGGGDNMMGAIGTGNVDSGWLPPAWEPPGPFTLTQRSPSLTQLGRWPPSVTARTGGCP